MNRHGASKISEDDIIVDDFKRYLNDIADSSIKIKAKYKIEALMEIVDDYINIDISDIRNISEDLKHLFDIEYITDDDLFEIIRLYIKRL